MTALCSENETQRACSEQVRSVAYIAMNVITVHGGSGPNISRRLAGYVRGRSPAAWSRHLITASPCVTVTMTTTDNVTGR